MKQLFFFLLIPLSVLANQTGTTPDNLPYPTVKGKPTGEKVVYSPDPLVFLRIGQGCKNCLSTIKKYVG